jgi:membrane protein
VRLSDAFTGGLVAGALFEVAKRGFGLYVTHIGGYNAIYGAFATLPMFLVWVYLSWLVVLCGAVLVAVMPQVRASSTPAEASGMTLPAGDSADASPGAPSGAAVQIRADDEAAQAQRERVSEG